MGQLQNQGVGFQGLAPGQAELVFLQSRGNVQMGLGVHIRVDAQADPGHLVHFPDHGVDAFELLGGFHIEHEDARQQSLLDFPGFFAHAGINYLFGRHSGAQGAEQFPAGDDIRARSFPGQDAQQAQIGVGLDRVAGQMRDSGEGRVEGPVVSLQSRGRINSARDRRRA